jgi:hypothetical protein
MKSSERPDWDRGVSGVVHRLNARLKPYLGPADLGDPLEPPAPVPPHGGVCPLCGGPMDEHVIDRSGFRTQLLCPVR